MSAPKTEFDHAGVYCQLFRESNGTWRMVLVRDGKHLRLAGMPSREACMRSFKLAALLLDRAGEEVMQ